MTEQTDTTAAPAAPEPATDAPAASPAGPGTEALGASPAGADAAARPEGLADRPEVLVAGAFAGGLVLAMILRGVRGD
jgi:hypothetical protein